MGNDRHPRASAMFTELDRAANTDLLHLLPLSDAEREERVRDVRGTGMLLMRRLAARRESSALPSYDRAPIERLSRLQLDIFRRHYAASNPLDSSASGEAAHGLELPAIGEAFLRFAHGDLRDAQGSEHGQPNSANAFCFAEFAFLACELAIDAPAWRALAPILVQLQDVYVEVYWPRDRPRQHWRFVDYGMRQFDESLHRDLRADEIAALLALAREGEPESRATANVLRAFPAGVQI